mgnify:CR=1 FL=1
MSTKGERARDAWKNLALCCQTTSDSECVSAYVRHLENENKKLQMEVDDLRNKYYGSRYSAPRAIFSKEND